MQNLFPLIEKSVETLGFHFSDIKIILISHAHDDMLRVCACEEAKRRRLMVMDADVPKLNTAARATFISATLAPVKVDRILHDLCQVELGGIRLPRTSHRAIPKAVPLGRWIDDGGRRLHAVIVGSPM